MSAQCRKSCRENIEWLRFGKLTGEQAVQMACELNAWLGDRCRTLWDEVRHPEYDQFSLAEMLENERPHLMPMPSPSTATWRIRRG